MSACLPLLQFAVAVAVIAALQFLFYRTALGRAFRATSDDPDVAQLMGLDNRHVFALAMALSLAVVAIAGVFLAVRANFDPSQGPARLIFGFEAVIIGGLGSLWGTLAGGLILGVAQAIGAHIDPGWQVLAGHIAFLVVLAVRPQGLFPKDCGHEGAVMSVRVVFASRSSRAGAASVCHCSGSPRRRAVLGRPRRSAAVVGNLRLCRLGEPVESARRLCRPRFGRPAGLCRARRLCPVRARHPRRHFAVMGDPDRGRGGGRRVDPGGGFGVPAARALFRHRHLDRGRGVPAHRRAGFASRRRLRHQPARRHRHRDCAVAATARLHRSTGSRLRLSSRSWR